MNTGKSTSLIALSFCSAILFLLTSCNNETSIPAAATNAVPPTGPRLTIPEPLPGNLDPQFVVTLIAKDDGSFELQRGGKPYRVKGAGGEGSLEMLAACGGNSGRLWGVDDNTLARLDEAHANGLTVALGIWLEHESDKFSYSDYTNVSQQIDLVLDAVRKYKDHPAVLAWGLGNEMENSGGGKGDNPAIWSHIGYLASLVKAEDPNHPVMTVIAEVGGRKVKAINKLCPDVDIIGINSYGGARTLPERYIQVGGTKPYIVTEFGPIGTWEVNTNDIGAIDEPTSTAKTEFYKNSYEAFEQDSKLCLGSYAFLWGNKQEATSTWFGMLTEDGKKTAAVDLMQQYWTGKNPTDLCPEIESLKLAGGKLVDPGSTVEVSLAANDPEGKTLNVAWKLMQEADSYVTGGFKQETPPSFDNALVKETSSAATFKMPDAPGMYRIYAFVDDGNGAAIANTPVRVKGATELVDVEGIAAVELPYVMYDEPVDVADYVPSGFMGSTEAITVNQACKTDPKAGEHCIKCEFNLAGDWGGVAWQSPENDWGEKPGGLNLRGAKQMSFWARGGEGGEEITFGVGLIGREKPYFDTAKKEIKVVLTGEWKQYTIDLSDSDLGRIKSGFFWSLAGQGKPLSFYLDELTFE